MKSIKIFLVAALLSVVQLPAQIGSLVKSDYSLSKVTVKKGEEVTLIFTLNLPKNCHVYSNVQEYQIGPMPACFVFEPHSSYQLLGRLKPVGPKSEYEPIFDTNVNYFEGQAVFHQKVKVLSDNFLIKGYYDFQLCSLEDGTCILNTENFEFKYLK